MLTTDKDPITRLGRPSAFASDSLSETPIFFERTKLGSFNQSTSASNAKSYEHVNLSVSASVGGSFLGASGRGNYESAALKNVQVSW